MNEYAKNIQTIEDMWKKRIELREEGGERMTFKGNVYWKDQCKFCKGHMLCKYRRAVDLLMARLHVIELESQGCYGSLAFWCDYYQEDTEAVKEASKKEMVVGEWV